MSDPRDPSNPLSPEQIASLRRARGILNQTQLAISKACKCGLDMRGEQAICDAQCARVDALLQHYGTQDLRA